jgi:hypothetical protein
MRRTLSGVLPLLWLGLCACGVTTPVVPVPSTMVQVAPMSLQPVQWSAQVQPFGTVMAVTDAADQVVVFGSGGAFMFSGGALTGNDNSVTSWQGAAVVPALGLPGTWVVGLSGAGRIYRARNGTDLVEVTQSYNLQGMGVSAIAPIGGPLVAFALPKQVAVTNGSLLSVYQMMPRDLAAGGGRVAAIEDDTGVLILTPGNTTPQRLDARGATSMAFDLDGHLVVTNGQQIFREQDGNAVLIYDGGGETIQALAPSGGGIWVAIDDSLALLSGSQLLRGPSGQGQYPSGGKLIGSPSGDVWIIADGKLSRMTEAGSASADEVLWRETVLPVFNGVCRACHLPGGLANLDLSTYAEWSMRRTLIGDVVLTGKPTPMPPAGTGSLTAAQLAAVKTWVDNTGM